jgi:CheY-like chemotaxis protein/PAS domain-containing protein
MVRKPDDFANEQGGFVQFPMDEIALQNTTIQTGMLEVIADAFSAGLVIYDAQDKILFASKKIETLLTVPRTCLVQGQLLRDLFGAYYDSRNAADPEFARHKRSHDRTEWIAENLTAHWKERSETEDRLPGKRWLRFSRRRLAGGVGLCLITDISEQKRSENQWRFDIDRVQVIEEMLDRLSFPITVTDQNHIYVGANKAACSFMHKPIDSIMGRSITDLHVPALAARIQNDNAKVLETGQPLNVPERIGLATGEEQLYVTHKIRVGKQGMHFVLSCMQEVTSFARAGVNGELSLPGLEALQFVRSPANSGIKVEDTISEIPKVLLVCSDVNLAEVAKLRLTICGMEADYVTSSAQVGAVLDYCNAGNLWLDLVLVSESFDQNLVSQIAQIGLRTERVSIKEIEQSITDIVCTTLNVRCAQCRSDADGARKHKDCTRCEMNFFDQDHLDVLVVEDNPINQVVFAQILDSLKLRYRIVGSAAEFLDVVETLPPDLIFMDTTLPDMDGYSATQQWRKREHAQAMAPVPIIGIVALAFEGDREKCISSGMNNMLLKPLSPDMVETMLGEFVKTHTNRTKNNVI